MLCCLCKNFPLRKEQNNIWNQTRKPFNEKARHKSSSNSSSHCHRFCTSAELPMLARHPFKAGGLLVQSTANGIARKNIQLPNNGTTGYTSCMWRTTISLSLHHAHPIHNSIAINWRKSKPSEKNCI